jgi:hypothetical protein
LTQAYSFAYNIGITTVWPITSANLKGKLIRKHAAKMISEFAINMLKKQPNTSAVCEFSDIRGISLEMQYYSEIACELGIMGLKSNGEPSTIFNPNDFVTRAQF